MASDGTIASKLQLDGEQQYKKVLNDAYRSLRVLRSELKAETAELGRNASEQDKARTKMASLQKQIQQQQQIVKTLEKALADSKKEYADNAEVQDKWEEKLNKARATLADMQNALGDCEEGLSKFSDSMKETASSSGEAMQTVVSFNDAMKSIGNIAGTIGGALGGIFTNTVDTMRDMVEEMFNLMSLAWSAASDWKDIQAVWGGSLADIEKVYKGMEIQGIGADTVTGAMQKLTANIHKGGDDVEAALKEMGMTESQFSSHFDMFKAIMDDLSNHTRSDNERYNLAAALFGEKKGSDVLLMLDKWKTGLNQYTKDFEETGLALSSPQIEALEEVSQKITEVQTLWDGIKTNIGAKLSEILNMDQLSEDALAILRTIGGILNSEGEKRAELVVTLSDQISSLVTDLSNSIGNLSSFLEELGGDLQKSDNPLVRFIGQLISGLGGILDWLAEHGTEITSFLEKVIPWITTNKLVEATTGEGLAGWGKILLDLGLDVATLTMMGKAIGSGAAASAGEAGTAIGTSFLAKIGAGLPGVLTGVLMGVPVLDLILHPDKYITQDLDGGLPDNIGKTKPWEWKPLGQLLNHDNESKEEEASEPGEGIVIPTKRTPNGKISGWEITQDQAETLEGFWDLIRKSDNPQVSAAANIEQLQEAFTGLEDVGATLFDLMMSYGNTEINGEEGWKKDNLPDGWYQIINDINGALKNLVKEKYSGSDDEDISGKIGSAVAGALKNQNITVNVYVDGEQVTNSVNTHLGSLMQSGLFG